MNSRTEKSPIGEKNRIVNKTKNKDMGTRSITRVHDAGKDSKVILAVYRQMDGYFEGMGADLTTFLTDMSVVNGINLGKNPKKAANGMSCLAAQLVAHFKTGIGGIYIADIYQEEAYNYDIYIGVNDQLVLEGRNDNGEHAILLGNEVDKEPDYEEIAEFVYPDANGEPHWRMVGLVEKNAEYVIGYDLDDSAKFKKYRIDKVVGGDSKITVKNRFGILN